MRRHLALILLATTTLTTLPVLAQDSRQLAQAQATRSYSIPAGPLGAALTAFGEASGLRLLVSSELLSGRQSAAVSGQMSAEQALQRMLAGTGLIYRFTEGNTVTVVEAPKSGDATLLPPVMVQGQAAPASTAMIGNLMPEYSGGQVARGGQVGLLGNRDFMNTPVSTTSYTAKTIQDTQARTLADVFDNDPSVRVTTSRGSYDTQFMIRGFQASNDDIAYNGLFGILPRQVTSTEMAERVELLRGPSTMLGGINPTGTVGGTINVVPKRAEDEPLTRLTFSYMSDATFGTHADIGRRGGDRNQYGLRFNGVIRDGDTPVDGQEQEFGLGSLGLDFRGERIRIALDGGYQQQRTTRPLAFITANGTQIPDAPDASKSFLAPWSFAETKDLFGMARAEVDFTDSLTGYATVGGRRSRNITFGQSVGLNNAGNFGNGGFGFDGSFIVAEYNTLAGETGLRSTFDTGAVKHELSVVGNATRLEDGNFSRFFGLAASNIYNPANIPEPSHAGFTTSAPKLNDSLLTSAGIADTLSFLEDKVQLTLGVRNQRIEQTNLATAFVTSSTSYDESKLSPAAGLVVKPWENVSLFGNYMQGLTPGQQAPSTASNAFARLAPYETEQYEAGVKMDHGRFATTLSVFQITKPNAVGGTGGTLFSADGEQRNRGIELATFGTVTDGLRVLGGLTLIDSEQTRTLNGANNGKEAQGVPDTQLNLGVEWDAVFDRNLTFSGRMIHTSSQYYDAANAMSIPSWTRFDIGARYRTAISNTPVVVRANIENLFDSNYWASTNRGFESLSLGAPRTFLLSASVDF